jgi:hypothetical protein
MINESLLLRAPARASLSLSELWKRKLTQAGKDGAEEALKCADNAIEIHPSTRTSPTPPPLPPSQAKENPIFDSKYEKNATSPGLANPTTLNLLPLRVLQLCMRSALLQRGNALAAINNNATARATYERIFPILEDAPCSARVDWERPSTSTSETPTRAGGLSDAGPSLLFR